MRGWMFAWLAITAAGCSCAGAAATTDGGSAPPDDGSPTTDTGAAADAAPALDGGACTPASGTMHYDLSCGRSSGGFAEQIAVLLDDAGGARLRVSGRALGARSGCDVARHVLVTLGADTLADFDVGDRPIASFSDGFAWIEGPATAAAVAACASDASRFDAATLTITGATDGGDFTVQCGATGPGAGYPPQLVLTCHRGIDPSTPDVVLMLDATRTMAQVEVPRSSAYSVDSIDGTVHVIPAGIPFGPTPSPVDSSGWRSVFFTDAMIPGSSVPVSTWQLEASTTALGALCGAFMPGMPQPALILRVHGSSSTGPFDTELYSEGCYQSP